VKLECRIATAASIAIGGLVIMTFGQEPSDTQDLTAAPKVLETKYKFSDTADPLEMLQQTVAANELLLAKQRACLSALATLAEKAQADKSAAHRSTSHGVKK
jgi:hypothetical protein